MGTVWGEGGEVMASVTNSSRRAVDLPVVMFVSTKALGLSDDDKTVRRLAWYVVRVLRCEGRLDRSTVLFLDLRKEWRSLLTD